MSKVALLTVHGMGETQRTYADPLLARLKSRLKGAWDQVSPHVVDYQDSLQPNERSVWNAVRAHAPVHYDPVRQYLLYAFADAAGLENGKEEPGSAYEDAQVEIARKLLDARTAMNGSGPVVAITQSLGCQVLSSYLYDAQKQGGVAAGIWANIEDARISDRIAGRPLTPEEKDFLRGRSLRRWVSTGCNIPIFVAAHKQMSIRAIQAPPAQGDFEWLNLYDPDDVLGWPLQPLGGGYETLVRDRAINSGQGFLGWAMNSWNPMSHIAYWTDDDVLDPLEQMLRAFL